MRSGDDIVTAKQRVFDGRLVDKDVDRGAGDMTAVERDGEVVLDDETAAGAVNKAHAALHFGDRARIDQIFGGLGQRGVQSDKVGKGKQRVQRYFLDAEIDRAFG